MNDPGLTSKDGETYEDDNQIITYDLDTDEQVVTQKDE